MAVDSNIHQNLHDPLYEQGVFVPKGRNVIIANTHQQFVQEEILWSDGTPGKPIIISQKGSPEKVSKNLSDKSIVLENHELLINSKYKNKKTVFTDLKTIPIHYRLCGKKIMAKLLEAYAEVDDRCSGLATDNFERKYVLFLKRYDRASI